MSINFLPIITLDDYIEWFEFDSNSHQNELHEIFNNEIDNEDISIRTLFLYVNYNTYDKYIANAKDALINLANVFSARKKDLSIWMHKKSLAWNMTNSLNMCAIVYSCMNFLIEMIIKSSQTIYKLLKNNPNYGFSDVERCIECDFYKNCKFELTYKEKELICILVTFLFYGYTVIGIYGMISLLFGLYHKSSHDYKSSVESIVSSLVNNIAKTNITNLPALKSLLSTYTHDNFLKLVNNIPDAETQINKENLIIKAFSAAFKNMHTSEAIDSASSVYNKNFCKFLNTYCDIMGHYNSFLLSNINKYSFPISLEGTSSIDKLSHYMLKYKTAGSLFSELYASHISSFSKKIIVNTYDFPKFDIFSKSISLPITISPNYNFIVSYALIINDLIGHRSSSIVIRTRNKISFICIDNLYRINDAIAIVENASTSMTSFTLLNKVRERLLTIKDMSPDTIGSNSYLDELSSMHIIRCECIA